MVDVSVFVSWQFVMAALGTLAIVSMIKHCMVLALDPKVLAKGWCKVVLTAQNLLWGVILMISLEYPAGARLGQRAVIGLVAGFLSHQIYDLVIKRLGGKPDDDDAGAVTETSEEVTNPGPRRRPASVVGIEIPPPGPPPSEGA